MDPGSRPLVKRLSHAYDTAQNTNDDHQFRRGKWAADPIPPTSALLQREF